MKQMPVTQGTIRGAGSGICGQIVVEGIPYKLKLDVDYEFPIFISEAFLTYNSSTGLSGTESLGPGSGFKGSEILLSLSGPSGTQSITGRMEPPVPGGTGISGEGRWEVSDSAEYSPTRSKGRKPTEQSQ